MREYDFGQNVAGRLGLLKPAVPRAENFGISHRLEVSLAPQPKVAITLHRDEHLSVDIHQPKQGPVVSRQ